MATPTCSAAVAALLLGGTLVTTWTAAGASLADADRARFREQAERCRRLLDRSVTAFYLPDCVDPQHGGYLENLRDGRFAPVGEKFLTLQARQLWFFSTLAEAGLEKEAARRAARSGYEFIQAHFRDAARGGYFSKVADDGRPTDTRKHAYLNSFALYGLVAYHRASGDPAALRAAQELFEALEKHAYDGTNGGYHEFFTADWRPVTDKAEAGYVGAIGVKTYNTHLHLLESFAELYRAWPDPRLRERLEELLQINTSSVLNHEHGCNLDAWHPDWRVVNEPRNLRASYGHDVECAWLVLDAVQVLDRSPVPYRSWAEALVGTSLRLGYDRRHGGFFYGGPLGQPADDLKKEWWVQAEALVSMLDLFRLTGDRRYLEVFDQTLGFIERHHVAAEGGWWATRQADGSPHANSSRTSMWQGAYHNGRALLFSARRLEEMAR
ncbi:MAG: AGE family epimerase/isomerase [Limisphaerales bacterium]